MGKVLLIDTNKKPLNPIQPAQARQLLPNKISTLPLQEVGGSVDSLQQDKPCFFFQLRH
ncbi:MAG: hypothetical protein V7K32_24205 [Nostoc sp.]